MESVSPKSLASKADPSTLEVILDRLREQLDDDRLIGQKTLFQKMDVGASTGARMQAAGLIGPARIIVGGLIKYHAAEVAAWLANRRPDGSLYDARSWSPIWAQLQKRRTGRGEVAR